MMEIYLGEEHDDDFEKNFQFKENLASGSFGKVIRAIDTKTNQEVAVKILDKETYFKKKLSVLKQEIKILQQLKHKNIVKFLNSIEGNNKLYIVMKLLKGGTIKALIEQREKEEKYLTEEECSQILKNLLKAVKYLHERDIVHRDIKPENIMFERTEDFSSLKLIDFGVSEQYMDFEPLFDSCGTFVYMAPEQIENRAYSKPVDLWSCGLIMFILLNNGKHPLYKPMMTRKEFISAIKNPKWEYSNKISQMALSLLHKLLEIDPSRRYTADNALKHPWITREKYDTIPETYFDAWKISSLKNEFKQTVGMTLFLNNYNKLHNKTKTFNEKSLLNYALLVNKFSREQKEKFNKLREEQFDPFYSTNAFSNEKIASKIFYVNQFEIKISKNLTTLIQKTNEFPFVDKIKLNSNYVNYEKGCLTRNIPYDVVNTESKRLNSPKKFKTIKKIESKHTMIPKNENSYALPTLSHRLKIKNNTSFDDCSGNNSLREEIKLKFKSKNNYFPEKDVIDEIKNSFHDSEHSVTEPNNDSDTKVESGKKKFKIKFQKFDSDILNSEKKIIKNTVKIGDFDKLKFLNNLKSGMNSNKLKRTTKKFPSSVNSSIKNIVLQSKGLNYQTENRTTEVVLPLIKK